LHPKRESEGIAAGETPGETPPGGVTAAQFGSIYLNLVNQVELPTDGQGEPGDFAVARHRGPRERGIVFMRGNGSENASRLKSYGRFLKRYYVRHGNHSDDAPEHATHQNRYYTIS
jgi:hypothetical protein